MLLVAPRSGARASSLSRTAIGRAYLRRARRAGSRETADRPARPPKATTGATSAAPLETALQETIERGFAVATGEWYDGLNAIALGFTGPSGERYAVNSAAARLDQCPRDWPHQPRGRSSFA